MTTDYRAALQTAVAHIHPNGERRIELTDEAWATICTALDRAERDAEGLEEYRMRLAGALTALDGHKVDQSDPAMAPFLRSCPTIAAAIRERTRADAAEAAHSAQTAKLDQTVARFTSDIEGWMEKCQAAEARLAEAERERDQASAEEEKRARDANEWFRQAEAYRTKLAEAERERDKAKEGLMLYGRRTDRAEARVEALEKALRGTALHTDDDTDDGPCWCVTREPDRVWRHSAPCLQRRAALAAGKEGP